MSLSVECMSCARSGWGLPALWALLLSGQPAPQQERPGCQPSQLDQLLLSMLSRPRLLLHPAYHSHKVPFSLKFAQKRQLHSHIVATLAGWESGQNPSRLETQAQLAVGLPGRSRQTLLLLLLLLHLLLLIILHLLLLLILHLLLLLLLHLLLLLILSSFFPNILVCSFSFSAFFSFFPFILLLLLRSLLLPQ